MSRRLYLGVPEVAERYRCSEWTIYDRARRGLLPYRKPAGTKLLLFIPAELDALDDGVPLEVVRVKGGRVVRPVAR